MKINFYGSARLLALVGLLGVLSMAAQLPSKEPPPRPRESESATPPPPTNPAAKLPEDKPAPGAAVDPRTYIIDPEDIISIRVWREPELSGNFTVRPDGKITLPLVNDIQAGGLTPDQLQQKVLEALQSLMNRPQVVVAVADVRSKKYYITGEVNRPGPYQLQSKITVLEALSLAGGFREFADIKGIKIMRGSERIKFNYKDVIKGKKLEQNIEVRNGDHIFVP